MLRIEIYPIMDGMELWVVGLCRHQDPLHVGHRGERQATYVDRERIDKNGLEACVGFELGVLLTEFPELTRYATC
jgi:hypothetical protein